MKLLLGTKNKNKIIEMTWILKESLSNLELEIISLKDLNDVEEPIEDGNTFSENAVLKAKYYYDIFKIPTIADDSGISVNALDGTMIPLSGSTTSVIGKDKRGLSIVCGICTLFGFLIRGEQAVIPAGTQIQPVVMSNTEISL